jgi:hypothetical protein
VCDSLYDFNLVWTRALADGRPRRYRLSTGRHLFAEGRHVLSRLSLSDQHMIVFLLQRGQNRVQPSLLSASHGSCITRASR